MFHLVKLVFLLSILSGTANAQWGTVVAQNDTNRFITSQYKYGLVMPHQNVIVGILDTTITSVGIGGGNASKVIVGSLLDYEDNCVNYTIVNGVASCAGSYEKWRELEKSTSWYQADRGDTTRQFPTNYAVTISTGLDSINIWNRDTAELWMAFKGGGSNYLWDPDNNDAAFKDGIIYSAQTGDFQHFDFLTEDNVVYTTTTKYEIMGNIQQRNDASRGIIAMASSPTITSNNINAVAVVRDPFGLKDALGRPKHWWVVGTAGGNSIYNPHTNAIYDSGDTQPQINVAAIKGGSFFWTSSDGTRDDMAFYYSTFSRTADGWSPAGTSPVGDQYDNNQSGGNDLAWTNSAVFSGLAAIEDGAIVGREAPLVIIGSDEGLYNIHTYPQNPTIGARQRFSSTVNAPVEFGDAVLALALEDNTTDSSPYANTLSAPSGSGSIVSAVFGNGWSSCVGCYLEKTSDSDFTIGTGNATIHLWMKSASATNQAAGQLISLELGSASDVVQLSFGSGGTIDFTTHDGSSGVASSSTADMFDGNWHHIAGVLGPSTQSLYIDGVLVDSDANALGSIDTDDVIIGVYAGASAGWFSGLLDDIVVSRTEVGAEAIAKIHAEGRKKLNMGTPVFTSTPDDALLSNNVVDIDALDNGMWAVAFSDANTVQVFDGRIPVQQIAAPAGTVKSVALIQSPGTDSVGVAIGTTTNLKFVQPSVNLRAAMAHQYEEPIHVGSSVVVDSAGIGGIFWTGNDAIAAADNAGRAHVFVLDGAYGRIAITQNAMHVECASARTNYLGEGSGTPKGVVFHSTTSGSLSMTGVGVHVENCGVYGGGGGGSGGESAVYAASLFGILENNHVINSDNVGIYVAARMRLIGNVVTDADGACYTIDSSGDWTTMVGNYAAPCSGASFIIDAGSNDNISVGNILDGTQTDNAGTSTLHNEIF